MASIRTRDVARIPSAASFVDTFPNRHQRLMATLGSVPDPRDRRGVRYSLVGVLALAVTATLAGCGSFTAIGQWVAESSAEMLARFELNRCSAPDESTLRKLFARLDADALDTALGVWMWTRTFIVDERRVIAVDGKTIRGARTCAGKKAPQLVAAFDQGTGVVLSQLAAAATSNEIPAARTLLKQLDLTGAVVTCDALHTQTETAAVITSAAGDYVFTVKANMASLHTQLKNLPWKDVPAATTRMSGHGRRVTRSIKVVDVPDWIEFSGAAQVAQLRRTVTTTATRKKTVEIVYLITSADRIAAPPQTLASWVQGQWTIENRLHWVRDVTFGEDHSQIRTGHAPQVMATCRNLVISLLRIHDWTNIAAARRHYARHPHRAITLVLTS